MKHRKGISRCGLQGKHTWSCHRFVTTRYATVTASVDGWSSQPWNGNDMDTYADDLATLMDALDLKHVMLVGHSTGGGEVVHYIGRHGIKRVAKAVLVSSAPPLVLKTATNPRGLPMEVFDGHRRRFGREWRKALARRRRVNR